MPNRTDASIQDLQVKILTILHIRAEQEKGAGIYIIQRTLNKYKSSGKSFQFDRVLGAVKDLERNGYVTYSKPRFWELTDKGKNQIQTFIDEIGAKYQSLKLKLSRTLN